MGCGLTQSAGARVAFNVATVQSFIDEYGMNVQPATSTDFALKTVSIELLFTFHIPQHRRSKNDSLSGILVTYILMEISSCRSPG